jgi:protein-S-isoprenylcysteine O-methyltransferase Ste14
MGVIALIYSVVVYVAFFAAFLYLIPFMGGEMTSFIGAPKTIDEGASPAAGAAPALINIGLLVLFTKFVPESMERSTYVLATVILLVLLYEYWIPMPAVIWSIDAPLWSGLMTALFFLGIGLVLLSTFLINHFDLFGLLQGWLKFKNKPKPEPVFHTPSLYKVIRHPLYLGWIMSFWATSYMTAGHLLFASVWTIYIFVALGYEERDLISTFGDKYRDYMAKTPAIIPFGKRK